MKFITIFNRYSILKSKFVKFVLKSSIFWKVKYWKLSLISYFLFGNNKMKNSFINHYMWYLTFIYLISGYFPSISCSVNLGLTQPCRCVFNYGDVLRMTALQFIIIVIITMIIIIIWIIMRTRIGLVTKQCVIASLSVDNRLLFDAQSRHRGITSI